MNDDPSDFEQAYNLPLHQEQGIAAQIVQVVIAGNSVDYPRGLLNGQVTRLMLISLLEDDLSATLLSLSFII